MRISDWSSDVCSSDLGSPFEMCRRSGRPGSPDIRRTSRADPPAHRAGCPPRGRVSILWREDSRWGEGASPHHLRVRAVILDLEAQWIAIAVALRHRRIRVPEGDGGDPVAALRIGVGLHRPREADVGNTVVDERDIAYAGLDDRAFAPDDLRARGIVRAEKPAPALLQIGRAN